jgi:hypothetical protein
MSLFNRVLLPALAVGLNRHGFWDYLWNYTPKNPIAPRVNNNTFFKSKSEPECQVELLSENKFNPGV